jgi:hypothetical protein
LSLPNRPPKSGCDVVLATGSLGAGAGAFALLLAVFLFFVLAFLAVFFIPFFLRAGTARLLLLAFFDFVFFRFFAMLVLR